MPDTLRRIVEEVNTAPNLDKALTIVVRRVREAMGVDACNVYLKDAADDSYVLMAMDGFKPEAVGKIRFGQAEGLVGMVAEQQSPVNLDSGLDHPLFRYFPEFGGALYRVFLGVPLIHYRRVLGVLITRSISIGCNYQLSP